jgi:hypothetical protein
MTDHKKLPMTRIPVTVYKDDPATKPVSEWHEIWTARNPTTAEFVLCQRHGWWDEQDKQAHFNVPILSEPFKTEPEVDVAMDAQIRGLSADGWIHHFTTEFDPAIMTGRGIKLMTETERQNAVLEVIRNQAGLTASEIANRARITQADAIKMIRKLLHIAHIEEVQIGSETYRIPVPMQGINKGTRR